MKTHLSLVPLLAALLAAPAASAASVVYSRSFLDTDFVSVGYGGMRGGDGTGTLALAGVSGTVTRALLYWHGPQSQADSNASVLFDGNAIQGVGVGLTGPLCWDFPHSQAYRADVTSFVTGSGTFSLSGFVKPGVADINGVSLLVAFDDGNPANNRDIMLFEGNDSNLRRDADADGWEAALGSFTYTTGDAVLELGVADGQSGDDGALVINGQTLVPKGPIFQGDSVPNGPTASGTDGGLWDIRSFVLNPLLDPGLNQLKLKSPSLDDCLALVHVTVNLPAGSSPQPPAEQVPDGGSSLVLMVLAMTGLRRMFGRPEAA